VYPLCKIRNMDIFEKLKTAPKNIKFEIIDLMNNQPIEGATYSTHDMGMTFELAKPGEVYMICQGAGGGYGDVLLRDPALVVKDLEEDLISHETALDIYKVVVDPDSLVVDEAATKALREAERRARIARGKPFDAFVKEWSTAEPPADLPYFGSWDNPKVIYGMSGGVRVKMDADRIQSMFMPNPKDLLIGELQSEIAGLRAQLAKFGV
ncbi:MAG: acetone carboxylase subunit alpha, partial [Proteobacteria bacterium]|nr:acetone carboxylase subunit alpha [Pseudomonadota bacterium]